MKRYLSFGGGVNSVALYILMREKGMEFEAVFADHRCDWPETYEYIDWMQENGHPVTVIPARREGLTLYEYYWDKWMIPARTMRHCTDHFKVRPLMAFMDSPRIEYLGFDAGEAHRAARLRENCEAPLVDWGIDRAGCLQVIKDASWPIPIKSGCFLCPFQRVGQWEALKIEHPDLYEKACALEVRCADRQRERERLPFYLGDPYPVSIVAAGKFARKVWMKQQKGQMNLWGMADLQQCPYCML